jgi:methylated-DNA-protein-cysteine methyltransferase related protein
MRTPPDPQAFNQIVWKIAQQIPEGQVSTYGQIASMIPPPEGLLPPQYKRWAAIWVGGAMNATPPDADIPWQRVINSKGMISLPVGSPGAQEQRALLEMEGVVFDDAERIDFERFAWDGPTETWLKENHLWPPKPLRKNPGGDRQMTMF